MYILYGDHPVPYTGTSAEYLTLSQDGSIGASYNQLLKMLKKGKIIYLIGQDNNIKSIMPLISLEKVPGYYYAHFLYFDNNGGSIYAVSVNAESANAPLVIPE